MQADKQKILRETKSLPKLIGSMETFNKWVMVFDKKSKSSLTKFLHAGEVRDFRIKSKNLREAIGNQMTQSQAQVVDEDDLEDEIPDLDDEVEESSKSEISEDRPQLNLSDSESENENEVDCF